ncbi:Mu P family protein [Yersinia ruckeri]|uniref:Mu P family protein n=1 Tax=Yersinia ruckeri TaxID=29486 RepID=A0A380QTC3_YERRU|nr:Mu P family protein [Yersinia ruckeri]
MNDELTLKIGGKLISGWDQVRVTAASSGCPSDFDLSLMDLIPEVITSNGLIRAIPVW